MIKSNLSSTYIFWRVYSLLNQNLILFLSISSDLRLYLKLVSLLGSRERVLAKLTNFQGIRLLNKMTCNFYDIQGNFIFNIKNT